MSINHIETEDLRRMEGKDGLILQGCGGELQQWLDGINEMFTEAGILKNGAKFLDISAFEYDGLTCLLYPWRDHMKDTTQLYIYPASYAHEHGELEQYRASYKANIACKEAIEQAIADHYRDNRLGTEAVHQVLEQFGYDRMFYVLAGTVRQKELDGRISRDNKTWAKTIPVYENPDGFGHDRNVYFMVDRSHPGLVDLFLTQARLDYTKEHEKKVSIRKSMKQNTEQTAAVHTTTKRKEPER